MQVHQDDDDRPRRAPLQVPGHENLSRTIPVVNVVRGRGRLCGLRLRQGPQDLHRPNARTEGDQNLSRDHMFVAVVAKDLALCFLLFFPNETFVFKVELSGSMSLTEANEKYWKVNKPMEMFYSFQTS